MGGARSLLLAGVATVTALWLVLAFTGPNPEREVSGSVNRIGGVCLELERWGLFGWRVIGQTRTVDDIQNGTWHRPVDDPPCREIREWPYLVRLPRDGQTGVYRLCGIVDDEPCVQVRRVPFDPGPPGP